MNYSVIGGILEGLSEIKEELSKEDYKELEKILLSKFQKVKTDVSEDKAKNRKRPTTETGRKLEAALEDSWWKGRRRNVPKDEWDELFDVISIVEDDDF